MEERRKVEESRKVEEEKRGGETWRRNRGGRWRRKVEVEEKGRSGGER